MKFARGGCRDEGIVPNRDSHRLSEYSRLSISTGVLKGLLASVPQSRERRSTFREGGAEVARGGICEHGRRRFTPSRAGSEGAWAGFSEVWLWSPKMVRGGPGKPIWSKVEACIRGQGTRAAD